MKAGDLTVVKVRAMVREAYMAGFNASSKDSNGQSMHQVNQPPVGDVKRDAREYALARLPQGMQR